MISRNLEHTVITSLSSSPVVAILGPRQVGKTTLALTLSKRLSKDTLYLDLERDSDRSKLQEAELYLGRQKNRLVILDEVQRRPALFPLLRSLIDERIRDGERTCQFLILGSASRDLLQQSSESLAGRIRYLELKPFSAWEWFANKSETDAAADIELLWLRGGFPCSAMATSDPASWDWRTDFIATYLERDIPQLGPRLPAEQLRRLWTMLAHGQGAQLNAARLAGSMGVSGNTVRNYLDVLTDLYMVRQLPPWAGNSNKRLVKAPKVYVRDTGLLHRLANVPTLETLLGHPLCGESWEGFVIESILAHLPDRWSASYYRTNARAEIDLVLEHPDGRTLAIEVKRTLSPSVSKGFRLGCEDIAATERYYVIPQGEAHPIAHNTEAVALWHMLAKLIAGDG